MHQGQNNLFWAIFMIFALKKVPSHHPCQPNKQLRLSPAEPHFPILFPILVQSDHFIFLENRIDIINPLQNSYC